MNGDRLDRVARRLAVPDSPLFSERSAFDGMARTLARPVTRRRAVGLIGGAAVAASLLRAPGAEAQGCEGGQTRCTGPQGQKTPCIPPNLQCCNTDRCAYACAYSYRDCVGPGACSDTARMCTDPVGREEAGVSSPNQTKFCSQTITLQTTTCRDGGGQVQAGWCCRPNEDCVTFTGHDGDYGTCKCPPNEFGERDCGDLCCPKDQVCVETGNFISGQRQCKPPCPKGMHYDDEARCVCNKGQACRTGCCPEGKVCSGNRCVSPAETSDSFKDTFRSFGDFFGSDSSGQTAGSRGGGNYFRIAGLGGATPVRSALLLLAAVNAQGVAAGLALTGTETDRAYKRRVRAAKPRLPKLAGRGLDPGAAAALDKLLAAEAGAFAQIDAAATALARSRGALRAKSASRARRHALAAAGFCSKASKGLGRLPALRAQASATLRAAGVAEVDVPAAEVSALQASVETSGLPAELVTLLKGLGLGRDDLKRATQALTVTAPGGPALIGPLADPARSANLKALSRELGKHARKLRRRPMQRTRPLRSRSRPGS